MEGNRAEEIARDIPTDNSKLPWFEQCKDCLFAADDAVDDETGEVLAYGYRKGMCEMHPNPEGKKMTWAFGEEKCPDYE